MKSCSPYVRKSFESDLPVEGEKAMLEAAISSGKERSLAKQAAKGTVFQHPD